MAELSAGVQRVLQQVRRGAGDGQARRGFTVARTEALLRMREVPRAPWGWTLELLRAARLLACAGAKAPSGRAVVEEVQEGDERVVTLQFGVGGCDLTGADLRGILFAGVTGDEEAAASDERWMGEVGARWRGLVGAAINAGLADGPRSIEVRTASDARAYVRKDSHAVGGDPYGEHAASGRCPPQAFAVVIREARPGFGRRVAAWLARQATAKAQVERVWREALFMPAEDAGAIEVGRALPGYAVALGTHAVWGAAEGLGGPWLVRDGVRSVSLAKALATAGLAVEEFSGWIECASLRLTADEAAVTADAAWELLVAWLHDAKAHTVRVDQGAPRGAPGEPLLRMGDQAVVLWPQQVDRVALASGRVIDLETVTQRTRSGRDFLYTWRHQERSVPATLQARAHVLWPSELAALQAQVPELRAVPLRALGGTPQVERANLEALHRSSLAPVAVTIAGAPLVARSGEVVRVAVQAFVHRYPTDSSGAVALMSYGRRVAQVREAQQVVPGVTLVCELTGADIDVLRDDTALLRAAADRGVRAARAAMGTLLAQAMAHASPLEVPLLRREVEALDGGALGVRYRGDEARGVVLTWDESPLLGLVVGRDETHTQAITLQQVLVRVRDVGGVIVEKPGQAWPGWASTRPEHAPWTFTTEGRALVERVVGAEVLWDMPTMPEMHAQPRPAGEQPGLVQSASELARMTARLAEAGSIRAFAPLRAHLLAVRAAGDDAGGLTELPLFMRFDPKALQAVRLVTLADVLAEGTGLGLVPPGSANRRLGGPALPVTPGEACLLYAEGLRPAVASVATTPAVGVATHARPVRRSEGARAALLSVAVASPVAVGALRVEGLAATKVALWGGGLHIDDVELPAPLQCVGGRLILTKQGAKAGGDRLAGEIRGMCRVVVAQALEQRRLHAPDSAARAGLDAFVARCRAAAASGEAPLIADLLASRTGEPERLGARLAASLQKTPLHKLPPGGPRRFESSLRQALGRPLAVSSAILSWQAARLVRAAEAGSGWEVELGRRSAAIQRATAAEAGPEDAYVATALAIAGLFPDARAAGARDSGLHDEWVAMYRLLALVYAHAP